MCGNYIFERWKPIKGYEDLYEVSDWGRVRSLDRYVKAKSKGISLKKGCILKIHKHNGYSFVRLSKNGNKKNFSVHRLVAEAFLQNPDNLPQVNHKTECKTFNHFSTIEFCDASYNTKYGTLQIRRKEKLTNCKNTSKRILQYNNEGILIKEWPSLSEIERILGYNISNIIKSCKKERKTAYGYKWQYAA